MAVSHEEGMWSVRSGPERATAANRRVAAVSRPLDGDHHGLGPCPDSPNERESLPKETSKSSYATVVFTSCLAPSQRLSNVQKLKVRCLSLPGGQKLVYALAIVVCLCIVCTTIAGYLAFYTAATLTNARDESLQPPNRLYTELAVQIPRKNGGSIMTVPRNGILRDHYSIVCMELTVSITTTAHIWVIEGGGQQRVFQHEEFIIHKGTGCVSAEGKIPNSLDSVLIHIDCGHHGIHSKIIPVQNVGCTVEQPSIETEEFVSEQENILWDTGSIACLDRNVVTTGKESSLFVKADSVIVFRGRSKIVATSQSNVTMMGSSDAPILVTARSDEVQTDRNIILSTESFLLLSSVWIAGFSKTGKNSEPLLRIDKGGLAFMGGGSTSEGLFIGAETSRVLVKGSSLFGNHVGICMSFISSTVSIVETHWANCLGTSSPYSLRAEIDIGAHLRLEQHYDEYLGNVMEDCHVYGGTISQIHTEGPVRLSIQSSLFDTVDMISSDIADESMVRIRNTEFLNVDSAQFYSLYNGHDAVQLHNCSKKSADTSLVRSDHASRGIRTRHKGEWLSKCDYTPGLRSYGYGGHHYAKMAKHKGRDVLLMIPYGKRNAGLETAYPLKLLQGRQLESLHHRTLASALGMCLMKGDSIGEYRKPANGKDIMETRYSLLTSLSMHDRLKLSYDFIDGLHYIHHGAPIGNFLHGDLRSLHSGRRRGVTVHNIVLDLERMEAKIVDFDYMFRLKDKRGFRHPHSFETSGKRSYAAARRHEVRHFGLFMWQLLQGFIPFEDEFRIPTPVKPATLCDPLPEYCRVMRLALDVQNYPALETSDMMHEILTLLREVERITT